MKLNTMKLPELLELAPEFAVDATPEMNKAQVLALFTEDGITQQMVDQYFAARAAAEEDLAKAKVLEEAAAEQKALAAEEARIAQNAANVITTTSIVNETLREDPITEAEVAEAVIAEAQKRTVLQRASKNQVLMFMDRENRSYSVRGYKFTHEHPFVLVKPDDAEYIAENIDGFRYATPKEAREYYS